MPNFQKTAAVFAIKFFEIAQNWECKRAGLPSQQRPCLLKLSQQAKSNKSSFVCHMKVKQTKQPKQSKPSSASKRSKANHSKTSYQIKKTKHKPSKLKPSQSSWTPETQPNAAVRRRLVEFLVFNASKLASNQIRNHRERRRGREGMTKGCF